MGRCKKANWGKNIAILQSTTWQILNSAEKSRLICESLFNIQLGWLYSRHFSLLITFATATNNPTDAMLVDNWKRCKSEKQGLNKKFVPSPVWTYLTGIDMFSSHKKHAVSFLILLQHFPFHLITCQQTIDYNSLTVLISWHLRRRKQTICWYLSSHIPAGVVSFSSSVFFSL